MSLLLPTKQVVIMFILMIVGWICYQVKFLHEQTVKDLTKVLLYVVSPCLIINSFRQSFSAARLLQFGLVFLLVIALFIFKIITSEFIFGKNLVKDRQKRTVLRYAGFMGVPLVQAILGTKGVFFAVPYLIAYNIFMWTHGIRMFTQKKQSFRESFQQAVINPNIIAAVIGMLLYITQVKLPDVVSDPMNYIANLNTPLSMIVIGTNLGSINLKADWQDKLAWSGVFVRNLFFPIVILGILYALPLPAIAKMTTLIMATCPVAGVVVLFSLLSNFDVKFPTKLMCLSTLGAIITIPLVICLATLIGL
ncbi:AEC family transporter [Lactobacillus paragasseri]|uniref:AEC family transporter n=1 Tax=Lactobacillus paragasseri TaxID=2107999 RepID=UPI00237F74AB|nr:AEC family transporter [Lactobacillus paragasseri]MDE3335518.1 AEC family transporter [Lactobacillus paragasseri]MDE3399137.1 AEC family transporter [Lactobacillus paragasseri]